MTATSTVRTRRSGERVIASITTYVEKRLKLKVNREKSAVPRPVQRVFLGYSFTMHRQTRIRVPKKSVQKMKSRLKDLLQQGRGRNLRRFIKEMDKPVMRRWMHYFQLAETKLLAEELDAWIRRRLRYILCASGNATPPVTANSRRADSFQNMPASAHGIGAS